MWPYGQSTVSREEGTSHILVCLLKAKRNERNYEATPLQTGLESR